MDKGKYKIILFAGIFLLMLGLPSLSGSSVNPQTITSTLNDKDNIGAVDDGDTGPKSSYTYDDNQIEYTGSNFGIFMESWAEIEGNVQKTDWQWVTSQYQTINPWKIELPTRMNGRDWEYERGKVVIRDMIKYENYIPNPGDPLSVNFNPSSGWSYPSSAYTYTDNYWGAPDHDVDSKTQNVIPSFQYVSTSPVVSGSTDFSDSTGGAARIQLAPATRQHTYLPEDAQKDASADVTQSGGVTEDTSTGFFHEYYYCKHYWANHEGWTTDSSSTTSSDNQDPSLTLTNHIEYGFTDSNGYGNTFYVLGQRNTEYHVKHSWQKTATDDTATVQIEFGFYHRDVYDYTYNWEFYYKKVNRDTPSAIASVDMRFTEIGALGTGKRTTVDSYLEGGYVQYIITDPQGTEVVNTQKTIVYSESSGFDQNACDLSTDIGSYLITGMWTFTVKIHFVLRHKLDLATDGHYVESSSLYDGSQGWITVEEGSSSTAYTDGMRVDCDGIQINIDESTRVDDTPGVDDSSYILSYVTSDQVDWEKKKIPEDTPVVLSFGYYIPDNIIGYDEQNTKWGIEQGYFAAGITIHKGTQEWTYYHKDSVNFQQVRGTDSGYGVGCYRFQWDMRNDPQNTDIIQNLNGSDYIILYVGIWLDEDFELSKNLGTDAYVYFRHIDFTFKTVPSAEYENMGLFYHDVDDGDSSVVDFVDAAVGTTASCEFDKDDPILAHAWDSSSADSDEGFKFVSDSEQSFNWTATFWATYKYWDLTVKVILTPTKTYIELNSSIYTPKPYAYGTGYGVSGSPVYNDPKWTYPWNDHFNVSFIVPRYEKDGEIYWNLNYAWDFNKPGGPDLITGEEEDWDWLKHAEIYLQENTTDNTMGDPTNLGTNYQRAWLDNELFVTYTSYGSGQGADGHGIDEMDWGLQFEAPNDIGNIILDTDTAYDNDVDVFYYRSSNPDYVYVKVDKDPISGVADSQVTGYFKWVDMTGFEEMSSTYAGLTAASTSMDSSSTTTYRLESTSHVGLGWHAFGYMTVTDPNGVSRSSGDAWLAGIFRGGMNLTDFEVRRSTELSDFQITNTIADYQDPHDPDNTTTFLFNSTLFDLDAYQDPDNMMNLSIRWLDSVGDPVENGDVRITITNYCDEQGGDIVEDYEPGMTPALAPQLNYAGDGVYWCWLDPMNMDRDHGQGGTVPNTGNVSWGYHIVNITAQKEGYQTVNFVGNFSVLVDTDMEYINPEPYQDDGYGHSPYDESEMYAKSNYTLRVKFVMNNTLRDDINNEVDSYYEGNVFLVYNLTAIHGYGANWISDASTFDNYVNESYFAEKYGADPFAIPKGQPKWPTKGYMETDSSTGVFEANILWPAFQDPEYCNSTHYSDYWFQADHPKVLEYHVTAYVQVNRTDDRSVGSFFQPNNVEELYSTALYVKLNDPSTGNYTKVIPTNWESIDGEAYAMGVYQNNSANVMSDDAYDPEFKITNYQHNLTYQSPNANKFRIRAIVNCTGMGANDLPSTDDVPAGWYLGKWRPFGPLNETSIQYGYNMSWAGNTSVILTGYYRDDPNRIIELTPDPTHLWEVHMGNYTGTDFTAYGITYVTPWLSWMDNPAGTYELYLKVHKDGFKDYSQKIVLEILEAPTAVLNGSKSQPDINTDQYNRTVDGTVYLKTPKGKEVSFLVNFTDITNYDSLHQTLPVTEAYITCYNSMYNDRWVEGTGRYTVDNLGNGIYNITLTGEGLNLDVSKDEGDSYVLNFRISQTNYTTRDFDVNVTIMKHETEMLLINKGDSFQDYYYPHPEESDPRFYSPFVISQVNYTIQIYDKDIDQVVDLSLSTVEEYVKLKYRSEISEPFQIDTSKYTISKYYIGPNATYNFTVVTTMIPHEYNVQIEMNNTMNYFDCALQKNFTILQGIGAVVPQYGQTIDTVQYYKLDNSHTADTNMLPLYTFKLIDTLHNYKSGDPIEFGADSAYYGLPKVSSNFTNPYRTNNFIAVSANYTKEVLGEDEDNLIRLKIDITGYDTLVNASGDYQPRMFEVDFNITRSGRVVFQPLSYVANFTITNASTQIATSGFGADDVMVKVADREDPYPNTQDSFNLANPHPYSSIVRSGGYVGDIISWNNPYSEDVPYGFLIQVWIGYKAKNTVANEFVAADAANNISMVVKVNGPQDNYTGIVVETEPNPANLPYLALWFHANQSLDVYGPDLQVNFTVYMWAKNYDPQAYNISFNIIRHQTIVKNVEFQNLYVPFHGTAVLTFSFAEHYVLDGIERFNDINNGVVFQHNITEDGTNSNGEQGVYRLEDGTTISYKCYRTSEGRYRVEFDTTNLDIKQDAYYINISIGVPGQIYESQQIIRSDGGLPYFYILPAETGINIWLNTENIDPTPGTTDPVSYLVIRNRSLVDSVYIWIQIYIQLDDEQLTLTTDDANFTVTIQVFKELNETDDEGEPKTQYLYSLELQYEPGLQMWKGQIEVESEENITQILSDVTILRISVVSDNPNYQNMTARADIVISQGGQIIIVQTSKMLIILLGISLGIVGVIGVYGVNKALKLRIPYVLRMIDETIEKIQKDQFLNVGVMMGRQDFIINKVIDYLDMCDIEWEIEDKFEEEDIEEVEEEEEEGEPMTVEEIAVELNKIESLTPDERALFIEEMKNMSRKEQEEFLDTLRD